MANVVHVTHITCGVCLGFLHCHGQAALCFMKMMYIARQLLKVCAFFLQNEFIGMKIQICENTGVVCNQK
jgi:hypothetical protein